MTPGLEALLVVGDDTEREALAHLLAAEGVRVRYEAELSGVQQHLRGGVACVVVEAHPGDDLAFSLLHDLRAHPDPAVASARVVVSSSRDRPVDRVRAWEAGCDGFVAKPYHVRDLADLVSEVAARSGRARERVRTECLAEARRLVAEELADRP